MGAWLYLPTDHQCFHLPRSRPRYFLSVTNAKPSILPIAKVETIPWIVIIKPAFKSFVSSPRLTPPRIAVSSETIVLINCQGASIRRRRHHPSTTITKPQRLRDNHSRNHERHQPQHYHPVKQEPHRPSIEKSPQRLPNEEDHLLNPGLRASSTHHLLKPWHIPQRG